MQEGTDFAKLVEKIIDMRTKEVMMRSDKAILLVNDTLKKMLVQLGEMERQVNQNSDMIGKSIQAQQEFVGLINQTQEMMETSKAETEQIIAEINNPESADLPSQDAYTKITDFCQLVSKKLDIPFE